ncbi:hypothetical protein [Pseudomonas sp. UMAB-40]|uniref:hypothetical protein n=1 Tax=Pseudomonas sp. UMAB-40 TaxID=1365407 RepID=UPI00214B533E|nr:hypothetical protein [Pseudomonas sp. UMAB-40]
MPKFNIVVAVSALSLLSLGGCASQSQLNAQSQQLAAIELTLTQMQANQVESIALQKTQVAQQIESQNIQTLRRQQKLKNALGLQNVSLLPERETEHSR